jgi:hypothetical protein
VLTAVFVLPTALLSAKGHAPRRVERPNADADLALQLARIAGR